MSDGKKNPAYDEQALARVLEAAFVLQEHQQELEGLKGELARRRKQTVPAAPEVTHRARAEDIPSALRKASDPDLVTAFEPPAPVESVPVIAMAPAQGAGEALQEQEEQTEQAPRIAPVEEPGDPGALTHVLETQRQIKEQELSPDYALTLIAERLVDITGAAGDAIGVLDGNLLRYRAAAGFRTPQVGAEVSADKALCAPCLRRGQTFRCADVNPEFLINTEECRRRGIGSLIAVPIFRADKVAGGVELYYSDPRAFSDRDIESCQLMAGLITDLLSREDALHSKYAEASQASVDLDAPPVSSQSAASAQTVIPGPVLQSCYKCGHELVGDEQFCGQCGSPRTADTAAPLSLQSKVASMWHMQESSRKDAPDANQDALADSLNTLNTLSHEPAVEEMEQDAAHDRIAPTIAASSSPHDKYQHLEERENVALRPSDSTALTIHSADIGSQPPQQNESAISLQEEKPGDILAKEPDAKPATIDWTSAFSAREFFEQFSSDRQGALLRFWNTRRGDLYLAVAVILVICVLRWGIWADHPHRSTPAPTASAAHVKPAQPELPLVDRMLIGVGLAEAPEPPPDKGNPTTRVWIDLHTALYYCPGADLYGKTPKGKYASQREAQLDQFEPAYRKNCN